MNILDVHTYLIKHDIRPSVQRSAIMKYLMDHRTHPTIDQIFNDLLTEVPTLSKTTVYNTLKLFHDKKAVLSLTIDEKNVRFDAETRNHAHFKCKKCGGIYDIPLSDSEIPSFNSGTEHKMDETQVYFIGTCKNCL